MTCQAANLGPDTIVAYQGESVAELVQVYDENRDPADLTGATLTATVVRELGGDPIITKSSTVPTQILILAPANEGQAKIFFVPADTATLAPGDYIYDVWVTLIGGEEINVVPPSRFTVLQGATPP
jgi:hypothetical protein